MIRTTLIVAALAILLAWLGPAIDDHSAENDQADDLQAAQQQADAHASYERAAQQLCGANAGWRETADGSSIQCFTKRGHPTQRITLVTTAQVQP